MYADDGVGGKTLLDHFSQNIGLWKYRPEEIYKL